MFNAQVCIGFIGLCTALLGIAALRVERYIFQPWAIEDDEALQLGPLEKRVAAALMWSVQLHMMKYYGYFAAVMGVLIMASVVLMQANN